MKHIAGDHNTVKHDRRRDEETQTTRTRRIERDMKRNPETNEEERTKTTTREKRGPDGRLQGVKSRTRHTPNRIDEFEDNENYMKAHRDKLP